jgi:nicotinamide-nucleotide amidase
LADLDDLAVKLVAELASADLRLVLAESCTGGLVAATLAKVPGVSSWLAGSMVAYQEASKVCWLGVASETLEQFTAVSAPVAHQMVAGVLQATPHADLAAAVTGHLGPEAPEGFDALVYIGTGSRGRPPRVREVRLQSAKRVGRQREAAAATIEALRGELSR